MFRTDAKPGRDHEAERTKMSKTPSRSELADELERVISHLDTLYEQGLECRHPDTHVVVTDGEYDGLRRQLKELRPDAALFATATASEFVSATNKVVHDPPMTSIEKASHEDLEIQEDQLFKWLLKTLESAPGEAQAAPNASVGGRQYKGEPVGYPASYFYEAYKLDGVAIAIYYENGKTGPGRTSPTRRHQRRRCNGAGQIRFRCSGETAAQDHLFDPRRIDLQAVRFCQSSKAFGQVRRKTPSQSAESYRWRNSPVQGSGKNRNGCC